jgi:hypothetical protein
MNKIKVDPRVLGCRDGEVDGTSPGLCSTVGLICCVKSSLLLTKCQ